MWGHGSLCGDTAVPFPYSRSRIEKIVSWTTFLSSSRENNDNVGHRYIDRGLSFEGEEVLGLRFEL
jgi:hypothetical protein